MKTKTVRTKEDVLAGVAAHAVIPQVESCATVPDQGHRGSGQHVVVSVTNTIVTYGPFDSAKGALKFVSDNAIVNACISEMLAVPHIPCSANDWCERQDQHDWICRAEGEV